MNPEGFKKRIVDRTFASDTRSHPSNELLKHTDFIVKMIRCFAKITFCSAFAFHVSSIVEV